MNTAASTQAAVFAELEHAFKTVYEPVPPIGLASMTHWLLTSRDPSYGVDLRELPAPGLSVDRVLAHVCSFRLGISERVAVSIARRVSLVLLNDARPAGAPMPARSATAKIDNKEAVNDRPIESVVATQVAEKKQENIYVEDPGEERCRIALQKHYMREHIKRNGPFPRLCIDFTGSSMKTYIEKAFYSNQPSKDKKRTEDPKRQRPVMEYCIAKETMMFHGKENLMIGTALERLHPDDYEKQEISRYVSIGRQYVVVRWMGKARLVPGSSLRRISQEEFVAIKEGVVA